jgi:hypothetical protein
MKRILTGALAALLSLSALAATTIPVQSLTPTGSTAGQAVVSTGPTSAPAWGTLPAADLSPIAANTVLANVTGSTASPTAVAIPGCSTANSALQSISGTGLACGTTFALTGSTLAQFAATTSAQLAGVLSDETGTGTAVFGTSPTITTPNIVGTATNNNAAAGSVGEYVTATTASTSVTTSVTANAASISLTAGDWEVEGLVQTIPAGTTVVSGRTVGISTTSATVATAATGVSNVSSTWYSDPAGFAETILAPRTRIKLASTTTVYLVANIGFSVSTCAVAGFIRATRVR